MQNNDQVVSPKQAKELITDVLLAGLVPMISGSPGSAKSSIVKQIAQEFNLELIDERLAQSDPTDYKGFPTTYVDENGVKRAGYLPMDTFPLAGDPLPKGKTGWLLFLDEFNSAPISVQAAAYKLVLDRMVGSSHLHDKCLIVAAGNLATDNAIVNRQSTAMQSRLVHLQVEPNAKEWVDWANGSGIDHRVVSFISFKPDVLQKFDPDHDDFTFPCTRTWEFMSKIISRYPDTNPIPVTKLPILAGTVGASAAFEFHTFLKVYKDVPSIQEIVASPMLAKLPTEPSSQFALSGSIAAYADTSNMEPLAAYIDRLPAEFQVITFQGILKRNRSLATNPAIQAWVTKNAKELL